MTLNILQWNMNGYNNNYHELLLLIKNYHPDIICLQETQLPFSSFSHNVPKYYIGYFNNQMNSLYGKQGVGILIRQNVPHKKVNLTTQLLCVAIHFSNITLVNCYIPPSQKLAYTDLVNMFGQINNETLIVGDFNAWSPLWGSVTSNNRGKIIENFISSSNVIVLNDGSPTHLSTHKTFTNIDLSLASPSLAIKSSWHICDSLFGSDHFPIILKTQSPNTIKLCFMPKFKLELANWPLFQNIFTINAQIMKISETINVNKRIALLTKAIKDAANKSIPQNKIRNTKINRVFWWNSKLDSLRNDKQNLWCIFKNSMNDDNLIAYKKANALFKREVKAAKRQNFSDFTSQISPLSSTKKLWHNLRNIYGVPTPSLNSIKTGNTNIVDPIEIADVLANHWSNMSADFNFPAPYTTKKNTLLSLDYKQTKTPHKELEYDFTITELNFALKSNKGKTPGMDGISYQMLSNLPQFGKEILLKIYNDIFKSGVFPHSWSLAVVIPILKPNKPTDDLSSYRPISLLSCVEKIFEKMLAKRLIWWVSNKKLTSQNQVGFKPKHGTIDMLLYLQHFVSDALSTKNHATVLALDFEKAYDRIGVHSVLQQLIDWNVGQKTFKIIKAFMTNRAFRVRVNNNYSGFKKIENGIPQGSPFCDR